MARKRRSKKNNPMALAQFCCQLFVCLGLLFSILPFGFGIFATFTLPLAAVNVVFSAIAKNRTLKLSIITLLMVALSSIPAIGIIFAAVGVATSALATMHLAKILGLR